MFHNFFFYFYALTNAVDNKETVGGAHEVARDLLVGVVQPGRVVEPYPLLSAPVLRQYISFIRPSFTD